MRLQAAITWNSLDQILNQVILFIGMVWLARTLTVYDFGVMALPLLVFNFFRTIQDLGTTNYIVKEKRILEEERQFILGLLVAFGIFLFLVFYFLVPFFLKSWSAVSLTYEISKQISFGLVLCIPSLFLEAHYRKDMDFKSIFYINTLANISSFALCAYLINRVAGHQVLTFRLLIFLAVATVAYVLKGKYFVAPTLVKTNIPKIFRHSLGVSGDEILNFFIKNLDSFFVGKFLGVNALGLYDRGYRFLSYPVQQVSANIGRVLLPFLAQENKEGDQTLQKTIDTVMFFLCPFICYISFFSKNIVVVILGAKWLEIVPLVSIFSFGAIAQSIINIGQQQFYISDRSKELFKISLFLFPIYMISFLGFTMVYPSILFLSIAYVVISFIHMIYLLYILDKEKQGVLFSTLNSIMFSLFFALIVTIPVWLLASLTESNSLVQLISTSVPLVICYLLIRLKSPQMILLTKFISTLLR